MEIYHQVTVREVEIFTINNNMRIRSYIYASKIRGSDDIELPLYEKMSKRTSNLLKKEASMSSRFSPAELAFNS